jgi:hypothetical protein
VRNKSLKEEFSVWVSSWTDLSSGVRELIREIEKFAKRVGL